MKVAQSMRNLDLPESSHETEPASERKHNLGARAKAESMHYSTQQAQDPDEVAWELEQERLEKERRIRDFEERQKENQRKKQEKLDNLAKAAEHNYSFKPNTNKRKSPERQGDVGDRLHKQGVERIGRLNPGHSLQTDEQLYER